MKKIIKITLSLLFIAASFTSCVDDKDFDTPQVVCDDAFITNIPATKITSFENVINKYVDGFTSFSDEEIYFIGYVTSSDLNGNFYKEIYIQDKMEDPTYALKLDVDVRGMYAKYPIGSKLYILLSELALDKSHGVLTLGENSNETLGSIRENVAKNHIFRSCTQETIVPIQIASSTVIDDTFIGKYVELIGAQFDYNLFDDNNLGQPYADPNEQYNTFRDIVFCVDNSVVKMEVSSFAKFSDLPLPNQKFDISGVLTRDYFDDNYVLKINATEDILTNDTERCDPNFLDCGNNTVGGSVTIYEEKFETYADYATSFGNWTNANVNGGNELFQVRSFSGNKYVEGSAYQSEENPLEMWLITESIDLDNTTDEELTFKTQAHHANGVTLSVYVSTDYSGDIATATWSLVQANIGTTSSTYGPWTDSGSINISCLEGNVYLAFKYTGGDGGVTTGMNIDDIKITGNSL